MNKNVIYAALMFVVTMSSGKASAQQLPYQNPALSAHERAVDLCGRLTLEEKASLMLDDSPAIPRLGIKRFQWWSEAQRIGPGNCLTKTQGCANSKDDVSSPCSSA